MDGAIYGAIHGTIHNDMTIGVKIGVKILRINIKRLGLKKLKHNGHIKSIKTEAIKTIVEQLMIKFVNKINRVMKTTTNHNKPH